MFILGVMSTKRSFRVTLTSDLRNNSHFIYMWHNSPTLAQGASLLRFLDHTHAHTHPVGLLWTSD